MLSTYLPSILAVSGLMMISLISPGPDFAIVFKNSFVYSRRKALFTAFGIAVGILFHVTHTLLGIGIVIAKSPILFSIIKYLGAAYLLYIGSKALMAKKMELHSDQYTHKKEISDQKAFISGFLTNILNAKAMLFFVSLLSQLIAPNTPLLIMAIYAVIIFLLTLGWFSFVAFCLTSKKSQKHFSKFSHVIERVAGGILIALGFRIVLK